MVSPDEAVARLDRYGPGFSVIKVKLGDDLDRVRVQALRRVAPAASIRVDVNEGWTYDQLVDSEPWLSELGVTMVEQPLHRSDVDGYRRNFERRQRLAIFLDESVTDVASVASAGSMSDGINVKLFKTGGIHCARGVIGAARQAGLRVMIGCGIESELGISAALQLASAADHIDLDGHLGLSHQPWTGLVINDGRYELTEAPGLGVTYEKEWTP
jgi:L-Ala-D/L-Glu epimerase